MRYINRTLASKIEHKLQESNKAVVVYGARQVGKTTLSNRIIEKLGLETTRVNADRREHYDVLSSRSWRLLRSLVAGSQLLFIDEAQRIPNIGLSLKILVDKMPDLKILVTGSSSFELSGEISEPLTGRAWTYKLHPVSVSELRDIYNPLEINSRLEELLVYGSYPEVFAYDSYRQKQEYLMEVTRSYLYRDVLQVAQVKYPEKMRKLLKLIAFQVGSEVSTNGLANQLGLGRATVERYLNLLEQSYVIFRLAGFSRNLRKEISKMDKIYFYDLGVRNAVIENFDLLEDRSDKGVLWENFLIVERRKLLSNQMRLFNQYFWRLYTGAELDYVEKVRGEIKGFEFKSSSVSAKPPESWEKTYPEALYECINRDNYWDFLT